MNIFKVVPLCDKQKLDVNKRDILNNGLYRKCNVYKGGGGYDMFPYICEKRFGRRLNNQFVVQLYGCPLRCPYCYVTQDGIFGNYKEVSSDELIKAFELSNQDIFHLMGGAPALYIDQWIDIIDKIASDKIFHSDLLLIEKEYDIEVLKSINKSNTLYAISIKGVGIDFQKNTGVALDEDLLWRNLNRVVESGVNFYFTFTGLSESQVNEFKNQCKNKLFKYADLLFDDSFIINIINYKAILN